MFSELKQLMARIAMRYTGEGFISIGDIPEDELPDIQHLKQAWNQQHQSMQQSIRLAIASGKDLLKIKNDIAMLAMEIALEDCGGNLKLAARKLNVEVRTLQYIRKRNESWLRPCHYLICFFFFFSQGSAILIQRVIRQFSRIPAFGPALLSRILHYVPSQ